MIGPYILIGVRVRVLVFNTTFNIISVISWRSVLLVEETGVPGENHRPVVYVIINISCDKYACVILNCTIMHQVYYRRHDLNYLNQFPLYNKCQCLRL
jgi:hypothetical protein